MGNAQLNGVLAGLSAKFEAALTRADEEAARDLAFSLLQDQPPQRYLVASGAVFARLPEGGRERVEEVGLDYISFGRAVETLAPTRKAILTCEQVGNPPTPSDRTLVQVLRSWARHGARVEITTPIGLARGYLIKAASDHVLLHDRRASIAVGIDSVLSIRARLGS